MNIIAIYQTNFTLDNIIPCASCRSTAHYFKDCPNNRCKACDQFGHIAIECPTDQYCTYCLRIGHEHIKCPELKCNYCRENGHIARFCPARQLGRFPMQNQRTYAEIPPIVIQPPVEPNNNRRTVGYDFRSLKTKEVISSDEDPNWMNQWPKCVNCGYAAYVSNHATKAKCLHYYEVDQGQYKFLCIDCVN